MNLSTHLPASYSDPTWIDEYITKMGESDFWAYKKKVYDYLDRLQVGQWVSIGKITKSDTIDLFVKIAYFYVAESCCCYAFKNNHSQIKHYFDAREMEKTLELLKRQRELKIAGANGGGNTGESEGVETLSAQSQVVSDG